MMMKINLDEIKSYVLTLEDLIDEEKSKGRDADFLEGQLAAFQKIIEGKFEGKEV